MKYFIVLLIIALVMINALPGQGDGKSETDSKVAPKEDEQKQQMRETAPSGTSQEKLTHKTTPEKETKKVTPIKIPKKEKPIIKSKTLQREKKKPEEKKEQEEEKVKADSTFRKPIKISKFSPNKKSKITTTIPDQVIIDDLRFDGIMSVNPVFFKKAVYKENLEEDTNPRKSGGLRLGAPIKTQSLQNIKTEAMNIKRIWKSIKKQASVSLLPEKKLKVDQNSEQNAELSPEQNAELSPEQNAELSPEQNAELSPETSLETRLESSPNGESKAEIIELPEQQTIETLEKETPAWRKQYSEHLKANQEKKPKKDEPVDIWLGILTNKADQWKVYQNLIPIYPVLCENVGDIRDWQIKTINYQKFYYQCLPKYDILLNMRTYCDYVFSIDTVEPQTKTFIFPLFLEDEKDESYKKKKENNKFILQLDSENYLNCS
jgi:hypothetical protein